MQKVDKNDHIRKTTLVIKYKISTLSYNSFLEIIDHLPVEDWKSSKLLYERLVLDREQERNWGIDCFAMSTLLSEVFETESPEVWRNFPTVKSNEGLQNEKKITIVVTKYNTI